MLSLARGVSWTRIRIEYVVVEVLGGSFQRADPFSYSRAYGTNGIVTAFFMSQMAGPAGADEGPFRASKAARRVARGWGLALLSPWAREIPPLISAVLPKISPPAIAGPDPPSPDFGTSGFFRRVT